MRVNNSKIEFDKLVDIFENANKMFLTEQKKLILSGVSERSWYTSIAMYLDKFLNDNEICGYYVDTEYNRNDGRLKTIFDDESEIKIIRIICDVIVHSRGENLEQDNLICIEMKKSTAPSDSKISDKKRVKILTKDSFNDVWSYDGKVHPEHVCRYKLGIYYEIDIEKQIVYIEYYHKGRKVKEYNVDF